MTVWLFTGKLGAGKTLAAVDRIRKHLGQGLRVATNLDLNLDVLCGKQSKQTVLRLPDRPTAEHLHGMGLGCSSYDESKFGLLVLDECAAFLNAREWGDKSRHQLIEWFVHARKYRWNIIFIAQDVNMIDKQIRTALIEHLVTCRRLDKLAIPLVTPLGKLFGLNLRPPKLHLAIERYGTSPHAFISDRWMYSGRDLYAAYSTSQRLGTGQEIQPDGKLIFMDAPRTLISGWHLAGRYASPRTLRDYLMYALYHCDLVGSRLKFWPQWTLVKPVRRSCAVPA